MRASRGRLRCRGAAQREVGMNARVGDPGLETTVDEKIFDSPPL